jgi:hypothetical protein
VGRERGPQNAVCACVCVYVCVCVCVCVSLCFIYMTMDAECVHRCVAHGAAEVVAAAAAAGRHVRGVRGAAYAVQVPGCVCVCER